MPSSSSAVAASSGSPADPDQNGSPLASRFFMSEERSLILAPAGQLLVKRSLSIGERVLIARSKVWAEKVV